MKVLIEVALKATSQEMNNRQALHAFVGKL